jgi:hypothetical protein
MKRKARVNKYTFFLIYIYNLILVTETAPGLKAGRLKNR